MLRSVAKNVKAIETCKFTVEWSRGQELCTSDISCNSKPA